MRNIHDRCPARNYIPTNSAEEPEKLYNIKIRTEKFDLDPQVVLSEISDEDIQDSQKNIDLIVKMLGALSRTDLRRVVRFIAAILAKSDKTA